MASLSEPRVAIEHVDVSFRTQASAEPRTALTSVDLVVSDQEFICLLGPSGCGKTTLLNVIAGFIKPTSGRVVVDGRAVESPSPDCGMVFQEYGLFPWYTVQRNVEFGPRMRRWQPKRIQDVAQRYIEMVGLGGFENYFPSALSGGMKQRAGLARALANQPSVLLLDEPFAAVDAMTRERLQEDLLELASRERLTCLFVTHSVEEAAFLADRVVVMTTKPGRIYEEIQLNLPRPRGRSSADYFEAQRRVVEAVARARDETNAR